MFKHIFDFSYERNIQEALVFYFFYLIFEYYITIGICILELKHTNFDFIRLLPTVPFIFCVGLSVCFMFKKNLKDPFSIFLIILCLFFTITTTNIFIGLIPVTIFSTLEDCSQKKIIEESKKEWLEHERNLEKQLLTEKASANKLEEIKKHIIGSNKEGIKDGEK